MSNIVAIRKEMPSPWLGNLCLSCLEQAIFSNYLTTAPDSGYASPVAGIPAPGFAARKDGGRTAPSSIGGFFASVAWLAPFWAGCAGSLRARRWSVSGLQTRIAPPIFAFCSAMGGKFFPLKDGVQP